MSTFGEMAQPTDDLAVLESILQAPPSDPASSASVLPQEPQPGGVAAPKRRGRKPGSKNKAAAPPPPTVTPEEAEFWGYQVDAICKALQGARGEHWKPPENFHATVGRPAALVAKKRLAGVSEENPEALLIMVLAPYLIGALRAEYEIWREKRTARAGISTATRGYRADTVATRPSEATPRDQGGGVRPVGIGQNASDPEFVTTPFKMPGS